MARLRQTTTHIYFFGVALHILPANDLLMKCKEFLDHQGNHHPLGEMKFRFTAFGNDLFG
ncbi:MAG: hypothetical protein RIC85_05540 [Gammaproteobacteria bacterium]